MHDFPPGLAFHGMLGGVCRAECGCPIAGGISVGHPSCHMGGPAQRPFLDCPLAPRRAAATQCEGSSVPCLTTAPS